jgi:hypothetical protein
LIGGSGNGNGNGNGMAIKVHRCYAGMSSKIASPTPQGMPIPYGAFAYWFTGELYSEAHAHPQPQPQPQL